MIEDDVGHARLIEKNIRRAGIRNEILPFSDGTSAEAFLYDRDGAAAQGEQALLVLLDLNLPDMSGVDILRRLKENPVLKQVPVIVLTTTDDQREVRRCYELGCSVYMTKPVDYEKFAHAIHQLGLFLSVIEVPNVT
jgi:DNA-binding response OmpR family regulator